eukprot:scaffold13802_cov116-Isochrysis_galbana.AAC.3
MLWHSQARCGVGSHRPLARAHSIRRASAIRICASERGSRTDPPPAGSRIVCTSVTESRAKLLPSHQPAGPADEVRSMAVVRGDCRDPSLKRVQFGQFGLSPSDAKRRRGGGASTSLRWWREVAMLPCWRRARAARPCRSGSRGAWRLGTAPRSPANRPASGIATSVGERPGLQASRGVRSAALLQSQPRDGACALQRRNLGHGPTALRAPRRDLPARMRATS